MSSLVLLQHSVKQLETYHNWSQAKQVKRQTCQIHDSVNSPLVALYMELQHAGDLHAVLNNGTWISHSVMLRSQQLFMTWHGTT